MDAIDYDTYFVPALFEPWSRELIKRAQVWKGDRVADVACGTGIVACRIAGAGAKVTGVDLDAAMLAQAKVRAAEEAVGVTWTVGDLCALRLAAGAVELVTCQQGLQYAADRAAAAREMRRVIAPGGRAVVACWSALERQPVHRVLDGIARARFGRGFEADFSLGERAELEKLLLGAKFFAIVIEEVVRKVRFAEPERFVAATLGELAGAAVGAEVVAEAMTALAEHIVDGQLELMTSSLIAVARVKT